MPSQRGFQVRGVAASPRPAGRDHSGPQARSQWPRAPGARPRSRRRDRDRPGGSRARVRLPVPALRTEAPARHGAKLGPATNRPLVAWATSSDKLGKTCKPTCAIPWHRVPPTSLARSREDPAANNRLLLRTRSRDFRRIVGVRPSQVQVVRAALHEDPVVARAGGAGLQEAAAGPRVSPAIRPACKMGTLKVLRNVPGVVRRRRVLPPSTPSTYRYR